MKQRRNLLILTALAAVMLLSGCSKDGGGNNGGNTATGKMVSVTLPIEFANTEAQAQAQSEAQSEAQGVATNSASAPTTKASSIAESGFTVSLNNDAGNIATNTPATRTIAQELTNVWVLQFNSSGANVSTNNIVTLASGAYLTVPSLMVGTGYTIYVVANGMASGLTTINPATLANFERTMLHVEEVTDATKLPLSGKLTGVSVVDLGDGKGKLKLLDASSAITLKRIHAEVALNVDFDVTGYTLTGAELYNVPLGATYGWNSATTTFPNNSSSAKFNYIDAKIEGMASLTTITDGSKTTYKWFIGDNRRGEVAWLTGQPDRNSTRAPEYATFARVTLTNSTLSTQKIYYDIYLGSGTVTNFDLLRNHTYTATTAIKGTADFQKALIGVDGRVSSAGFPIYLTDSKADSPIVISPKSTESTTSIIWGPTTTSISGAQDIFNGKANTDALMTVSETEYPAAKYCRDKGAEYYLPSQAELMLMWIYQSAIPAADLPASSGTFWSSTEFSVSTNHAWSVYFSYGRTLNYAKNYTYYVRCVSDPVATTWKYPKVDTGNTIVSHDGTKGIKEAALLTPEQKAWLLNTNSSTMRYNEQSNYNKVSAKFEVASTDSSTEDTWVKAYTFCKSYSTGAAAGSWRLPTQRELMLIWMFKSKLTGTITSASGYFWSSTEDSSSTSFAWFVRFSNGSTDGSDKTYSVYVRCVRDL